MELFGITIPQGWEFRQTGEASARGTHIDELGSVEVDVHVLFDGVILERINLATPQLINIPLGVSQLTCVNYCTSGCCECDLAEQGSVVVGEGAVCVSTASPTHSSYPLKFTYPQGHYTGFELWLGIPASTGTPRITLDYFGINLEVLENAWCKDVSATVVRHDGQALALCEAIDSALKEEVPNLGLLRLATCNLLVHLQNMQPQKYRDAVAYLQRSQREMARVVHDCIQKEPTITFDIDAAAQRFGVSTSSLRAYFARVYGQSPSAFAREASMHAACRMLATTNMPVSDVALAVGYNNPSKFSAAFKRQVGVNPLEYKRRQKIS